MNVKCHICGIEAPLNILLGRHFKNHINDLYTKQLYKIDLLTHNGRPQAICPICNKPTKIPKGEKDYPKYHRSCYLNNLNGDKNPGFKGGKTKFICKCCNKEFKKHKSLVLHDNVFCTTSCYFKYIHKNRSILSKYLKKALRSDVRRVVKKYVKNNNNIEYLDFLGCSVDYFVKFIESKFLPGMTWNNWTYNGWHMDHIIPLASAKNKKQLIKLCHYTNLQPLWAVDNMRKSKKMPK